MHANLMTAQLAHLTDCHMYEHRQTGSKNNQLLFLRAYKKENNVTKGRFLWMKHHRAMSVRVETLF